MSTKRHYWSKMNHSEARAVTEIMTDEEAGRWLRGWLAGALGEDGQAEGKPMEWKMGFSAGKASFQDAQEFSRKQSERVSKRYAESTAVDSGSDFDTEATVESSGIPELPITNKQTNKQDKNKEHRPPSREEWNARVDKPQPSEIEGLDVIWEHSKSIPRMIQESSKGEAEADTEKEGKRNVPRQAAFTPPSEQEWVEYCTRTWSDWHPVCAGEAWAYYEGVGWVVGKKPCRDWKATARTAHGNARQWGKLQPQNQQWTPQAVTPIVCRPGELDGIDIASIGRL